MNIKNNRNLNFNSNLLYQGATLPPIIKDKLEQSPTIKKLLDGSQHDLIVISEFFENKKRSSSPWEDCDLYRIALKWNKKRGFFESVFNLGTVWLSKNFHDEYDIGRILDSKILQQRLLPLFRK